MDSQMKKDILASMEKNMPKQMGGLLLTRMKELEAIEKEGFRIIKENAKINARIDVLEEKDRKDQNLTEREANCSMREANLIIEDLKREISKEVDAVQVKSSNEKVDLMNNFVGLLMKNPQAITTMNQADFYDSTFGSDGVERKHKSGHHTTVETKIEK